MNANLLSAYSSITRSISMGEKIGSVLFNFGWKHITRQVPLASPIRNNGSSLGGGDGVFSSNAGKSFGNTYVDSYFGFTWENGRNCRICRNFKMKMILIGILHDIKWSFCPFFNLKKNESNQTFPFGRVVPGHNGFVESKSGMLSMTATSVWPLHGRCKRCGLTKTHWPVNGLKRLCWCSIKP